MRLGSGPPRSLLSNTGGRVVARRSVRAGLHSTADTRRDRFRCVECTALSPEARRVPRGIEDVDNGKILGFGADLAEGHPGYHDSTYKQRRQMLSRLAKQHTIGNPIPTVDYTEEERATWAVCLRQLKELYPQHACKEFNRSFAKFDFTEDTVPQLEAVSRVIERETGWRLRPTAGLMHPLDFLNGLAFKTFHSTQYMRHHSAPIYTPEPDLVHELLGHVAMLADPTFCRLMESIGRASLGASAKLTWHLTKIYWYTVEFGVVYEGNEVKAFGAGILSSYGELQSMAAGNAEIVAFDPYLPQPKMSYKDGFQKRYFALKGFEEGDRLLEVYADKVSQTNDLVLRCS